MIKKYAYVIGIDTGVDTGVATWNVAARSLIDKDYCNS